MTDASDSVDEQRQQLASAFGTDTDPLAEYDETFNQTDIDPFELFISEVLEPQDPDIDTLTNYQTAFKQWRNFMDQQGRHPACPAERHVKGFIRNLGEKHDNHGATQNQKMHRLNRTYEYWQDDPAFPHPNTFNPFALAKSKTDFKTDNGKELPRISLEELRQIVGDVNHIQKQAIIALQLKLGLRSGEVENMELQDVNIQNQEIAKFYPELGTHLRVQNRENAVIIPSRDKRDGNKSSQPRVLPLDDEMRRVLLRYLMIRPQTDVPWLFLSESHISPRNQDMINEYWKEAFHPEYAETESRERVTSHFGRHYFTTYWKVKEDVNRELVKYMRGDVVNNTPLDNRDAIDRYLHTYYEDIEPIYRDRIFKLNV